MTRRAFAAAAIAVTVILGPFLGSAAAAEGNMLAGAKWQYSVDRGKTWTADPPELTKESKLTIRARTEFQAIDTKGLVCLELDGGGGNGQRVTRKLNGKPVPVPLADMEYRTIPAIPTSVLKAGKNTLTLKFNYQGRRAGGRPLIMPKKFVGLTEKDLKIVTGPILGAVTNNSFTVTCRTNMPATVVLGHMSAAGARRGMPTVTPPSEGLFHRFLVRTNGAGPQKYSLRVRRGKQVVDVFGQVRVPAPGAKLRIFVLGDSRSNPPTWRKVAQAAIKAKPDLILHSGDLVRHGRSDWHWNEQMFDPAKKLFSTIPFYVVRGNHEAKASLYGKLFYGPGPKGDPIQWSQEINGVLLIGIDGSQDWSADGKNARWLATTLAGSKAKFIFLMNHYPAWTSGARGNLGEDGRPKSKLVRVGQDVICPLLTKYKATAIIVGHEHFYERSELPGGLTHLISGGAGAGLYKKSDDAAKHNPHSKLFARVKHYCVIDVTGDTAKIDVFKIDGKKIDTRTWKARAVK